MMSCHNLVKTLGLIKSCRFIPLNSCYAACFRHQKFKRDFRTMSHVLPAANFSTSVNCLGKPENLDERYYVYDSVKDMTFAIHEDDPKYPEVTFTVITPSKEEIKVKARVGNTIMKAIAKCNEEYGGEEKKIPMEYACNGSKSCTTCHVYCKEGHNGDYFTLPDTDEDDLLDAAPFLKPTSRLCCQMRILKVFDDNMTFEIPKSTVNFAVDKVSKKVG